jgi:CBS domain-containing protein
MDEISSRYPSRAEASRVAGEIRLPNLRVADIMTIDPVTIRADETIEVAERLLRLNRISGLPVVDADGSPLGVISQTDLLLVASPALEAAIRNRPSGLRVGELMTSPALTVPMTASLGEAARRIRDGRVHRLVAVDDDGQPVGVLSATDFATLFADVEE